MNNPRFTIRELRDPMCEYCDQPADCEIDFEHERGWHEVFYLCGTHAQPWREKASA